MAIPGVDDYAIRLGTLLFTMVEPDKGHEVEYNRWYEHDHFYAGCMIAPWQFAGDRFVATKRMKDLRYPANTDMTMGEDNLTGKGKLGTCTLGEPGSNDHGRFELHIDQPLKTYKGKDAAVKGHLSVVCSDVPAGP